ncbi:hypothetical protein BRADO3599 [Bradyrhizobium sp. ORS 278]|uniref:hypothetical protein n=1 Tax=Bradyrhizobium sp. (strain ORS 278) TaxID=114615 RepID=UPI0001508D61|nr:hypothetical protein [Bradyrhizobium sp. ORS 278]CAL77377.1 hypothetical protein BRADO3599 [Bradyrhizobium sp. ORS 278]
MTAAAEIQKDSRRPDDARSDEEVKRTFEALYDPRSLGSCSDPLFRFICEYDDLVQAFFFTVITAAHVDEMRAVTEKVLGTVKNALKNTGDEQPEAQQPDTQAHFRDGPTFKRLRRYSPLLSRNMVVGMANNFFSYISEMLQLVLRRKPEVLRSSERLTNEEVLQFTRVKELVAYMADKKVNELAYGGLKGVEDYVRDRLGIDLFANDDERARLTILAELRNIHTHNRGVVNEVFLKRVGRKSYAGLDFALHQKTHVDFDRFVMLSRNAIEVAIRLDVALGRKFHLRRRPYTKIAPQEPEGEINLIQATRRASRKAQDRKARSGDG